MDRKDLIKSLRDPKKASEDKAANPAGEIMDLDDDVLASVTGGCCPPGWTSAICSPCPPRHCL